MIGSRGAVRGSYGQEVRLAAWSAIAFFVTISWSSHLHHRVTHPYLVRCFLVQQAVFSGDVQRTPRCTWVVKVTSICQTQQHCNGSWRSVTLSIISGDYHLPHERELACKCLTVVLFLLDSARSAKSETDCMSSPTSSDPQG